MTIIIVRSEISNDEMMIRIHISSETENRTIEPLFDLKCGHFSRDAHVSDVDPQLE